MMKIIQTSRKDVLAKYSILLVVVIFWFLFIVILIISSVFIIFMGRGGIIFEGQYLHVPDDKFLYDLRTYTFKNQSLYRFNNQYIISSERKDENSESVMIQNQNENEITIMTQTQRSGENEVSFSVNCEGICNCFVENWKDQDRRISNLVYSHRYSSAVLVSMIGFAVAKFVNDHIDDCYEMARENLGISESNSESLTCTMENQICETTEFMEKKAKVQKKKKFFECNGHCVGKQMKKYRFEKIEDDPYTRGMDIEAHCNRHYAGEQIVIVNENDHVPLVQGYYKYNLAAMCKYRKLFLTPFCHSLQTNMWKTMKLDGTEIKYNKGKPIRPCISGTRRKNIRCKVFQF